MSDEQNNALEEAVTAFLAIGFDIENSKVFNTQRAAREEAHRLVGFYQAQNHLRDFLRQVGHPLAETEGHPQAIKPIEIGGRSVGWVPPELPVKTRRR